MPTSGANLTGASFANTHFRDATLCAANTREATHLMGAGQIAALGDNAALVNVGALLIDMDALAARLRENNLSAIIPTKPRLILAEQNLILGDSISTSIPQRDAK